MALWTDKLEQALAKGGPLPVYYLASTERPLLREAEHMVLSQLALDVTQIDGPKPDIGDVIGAAGSVSLFGDLRAVLMREIEVSAMADADVKELAELFSDVQSAVLVVTSVYKDGKAGGTKKAKLLADAAAQEGFALEIPKPTRAELAAHLERVAAGTGAHYARGAAMSLVERAGEDRVLLQNETLKLAAICGYGAITEEVVAAHGVAGIEANVFDLISLLTAGRRGAAFRKLAELDGLRYEPIAISAALAGAYVDMLRVRLGAAQRKPYQMVFKEMGYTGNPYRLKKAKENAARYSTEALGACVLRLSKLDVALKRSALSDKMVLMQAALEELVQIGEKGA